MAPQEGARLPHLPRLPHLHGALRGRPPAASEG